MHRNQMEHGMSAQTATQAMAVIRLALGDAAEPLLQVIRGEIAQAAEARTALARIAVTQPVHLPPKACGWNGNVRDDLR